MSEEKLKRQTGDMGAKMTSINPTSWAVTGTHEGVRYDGINVIPLPEQEKIVFTITTDTGEFRKIDEVPFPAKQQTSEAFIQITKQVIGKRLMVLL